MNKRILWVIPPLLLNLHLQSQTARDFKTSPRQQLYQLVKLPGIEQLKIEQPSLQIILNETTPGLDISKTITEARLKCSSLFFGSLLELKGERNSNEEVGLEWQTLNSSGNTFDVERSLGDTMNFARVNFVRAKDGIKNKYQMPDDNDYTNVSYYRIRQSMIDGSYKFSNTIAVKGYKKFEFKIYPNPSSANIWLNLSLDEAGKTDIHLYDISGKIVSQYHPFLLKGNNLREIDIKELPAGIYTLKIVLPDKQIRSTGFIKMK